MNRPFMTLTCALLSISTLVLSGCGGGESVRESGTRAPSGSADESSAKTENRSIDFGAEAPKSAPEMKYNFEATHGVALLAQRKDLDGATKAESEAEIPSPAEPQITSSEEYNEVVENRFVYSQRQPFSTFSIDVDTASYSIVRRYLEQNQLPPKDAVRIEELINYFPYDYELPSGDVPFAVNAEIAKCPWAPEHHLVRFGLKGKEVKDRPLSNLVFLLDVSGSMQASNKLPLIKRAMSELVDRLGENDRVAIVVYASSTGLALPSTSADDKSTIHQAIRRLNAGGSTNGGEGIELAYQVAMKNFIEGGTNRVILCTDGDFNIGISDQDELVEFIQQKAKSNVFLSVLGCGSGNYKDAKMERLADEGNGNYAYIDSIGEARKVLIEQMAGTLVTIAKDVKIQVEFNPGTVAAYRLIGYENRKLNKEDFDDDTKDAGEIGAGHTVTALYEIVPAGILPPGLGADDARYIKPVELTDEALSDELLTLKLRYKQPDENESSKIEFTLHDTPEEFEQISAEFQFATAVAAFGMILRDSPFRGNASLNLVEEIAESSLGRDVSEHRSRFLNLVQRARRLMDGSTTDFR